MPLRNLHAKNFHPGFDRLGRKGGGGDFATICR